MPPHLKASFQLLTDYCAIHMDQAPRVITGRLRIFEFPSGMPRSCGRASRDKIKPRPSRAPRETLESRPDSNNPADEAAASDRPRRAPRDHVVPGAGQGHRRTSAVPGLNFSLNRDENLLLADRGWQILGARARRSLAVDHITRVASDSHSQNLSGFDTENDLSLSGFTSPDTPLQEWSVLPSPRIILPSSVHSDRFLGDSRGQPFPEKEPATCANPVPPASRPSDLPKQDATQGGNVKEHQGENKSEATPSSKRPPPASPRCPRFMKAPNAPYPAAVRCASPINLVTLCSSARSI